MINHSIHFTAFNISYIQLIDEVSEDAGTVEIIRVEKQGQIEEPVHITFSGGVCVCVCVHYFT